MKIIKHIIIFFGLIFIIHLVLISADGIPDTTKNAEIGIVLGNKIEMNGKPSARLQSRLDTAYSLYNKEQIQTILVSGGLGKEGFLEGSSMAEYLIQKGIPKKDIIIDNQGNNTELTAHNASQLLDIHQPVIVISQFFHITRSRYYLKKYGFKKIYSASPQYFEIRDIYSILREVPALYVAWFT